MQLRFDRLALRDVLEQPDHEIDRAVRSAHAADRNERPEDAAALAEETLLERVGVDLAGEHPAELREIGGEVVGMGWELYVSSDQTAHVFEALEEAGADLGLKLCGLHTLDSCRIEKAYRHFGHDITDEDHVLEAGLGFAVSKKKPDYIGRDAVMRKQEAGLNRRMVQFRLTDPEPLLFHNEALVRDGKIIGPVTSGNYGHFLGGAIGMGYVPCKGESEAEVLGSRYEIEVAGVRHQAVASLVAMYDPKSERVRG